MLRFIDDERAFNDPDDWINDNALKVCSTDSTAINWCPNSTHVIDFGGVKDFDDFTHNVPRNSRTNMARYFFFYKDWIVFKVPLFESFRVRIT